ncbi:C-type lectin 37Da-like, partial [Drosophila pseudoobscura]|uniref:C-type lectin 37Da-like n=2 Tax=Drosophila pseudoobscura pseudoobscura TaxID=46245 RepID=A0A6I8V748_DROPS
MYRKLTGVLALLGFLSLSGGYRVISNVMDGVPEFVNINPAPFVKIGNGYYYIENKLRKNWFDAYESCSRMGAALISFETIEEWNLINKYLKDEKIDYFYWTSGTDLAKQGKHVWLSTGNPIALDIWHPSQPDNIEGVEHCDEM